MPSCCAGSDAGQDRPTTEQGGPLTVATDKGSILDRVITAWARGMRALMGRRATLNAEEFDAGYRCGYRAGLREAREELAGGRLSEVAKR